MSRFINLQSKLRSVIIAASTCTSFGIALCDNDKNSKHFTRQNTKLNDQGIESYVGDTPLIYLKSISEQTGCHIYGKAEFLNPTGSVKDRVAKRMLDDAERNGLLKLGGTIVEATGGNTGISLAQFGARRGYKVILFLPEIIAQEKIALERRFGATVYEQPYVPFSNSENYYRKAEVHAKSINALFTNQFENQANFNAHYYGTGPEIYKELNGQIDGFITAAGTGGTIAGISNYLKEQNSKIKCYLVDPSSSVLLNYVNSGKIEANPGI